MDKKEHIPEKIRKAGTRLPFEVPESYFDSFPGRLQEKMGTPKEVPVRRLTTVRSRLAIAAGFIGLIAVGYAGLRILSGTGGADYLSNEILDETMEYLAWELDEEMLISAIVESDLSFSTSSSDLGEEEIIQYLSEEDIDITDLLID
jgi:hypothetical protein